MARTKRALGQSGVYHVLLRSEKKLFADDLDCQAFLHTLREYFDGYRCFLLGYALLENRAHLILDTGSMELSEVMKPLCTSYARYFNRMHQKTGKLFYDRYKSKPLESGRQLADALAFVHAAPVRSGVAGAVYSSEEEYQKGSGLCDTVRALRITGGERNLFSGDKNRFGLEDYVNMPAVEIENYMRDLCGYGFSAFKRLAPAEQKAALEKIRTQKWVKMPRLSALLDIELRPARKSPASKAAEKKEELSVWLL